MQTIFKKITQINKKPLMITAIIVLIILAIIIITSTQATNRNRTKPEVVTVSTLEKIINVSKLSTFTAVYNGIAIVYNEKNPENIDYYVSYEAKVDAGINFEDVTIEVDNEQKIINIQVPDAYITHINVDISTLDYIFINNKANTSAISQYAFKACEDDVKKESQEQEAIIELANQSAENILKALISPIIVQMDEEYELIIS